MEGKAETRPSVSSNAFESQESGAVSGRLASKSSHGPSAGRKAVDSASKAFGPNLDSLRSDPSDGISSPFLRFHKTSRYLSNDFFLLAGLLSVI